MRNLASSVLGAALAAAILPAAASGEEVRGNEGSVLEATPVAEFDEPWAMAFLPDGAMLVTQKSGSLYMVSQSGQKREIAGVPEVAYGGQGGLGDIVPHPDFDSNSLVYLSYAEAGKRGSIGAAVARARLSMDGSPRLENLEVIWRQVPKVSGRGHYSHRIAFSPDGKLFISSGDRQKKKPAQQRARLSASTTMAACRRAIPIRTMASLPARSGASATAMRWASPSTSRGGCGTAKWDRGAAMS
jgi:glucose/arabinose dehydrogenase